MQRLPTNSFLLNVGMETLALRMQRHYENAQAVAEFLEKHPQIAKVNYPGLSSSPDLRSQTKILTERFVWCHFL